MKKTTRIALYLGVAFAGLFLTASTSMAQEAKPKGKPWPAPAEEASKKSPLKADANTVKEGKEIYMQKCKSCHGADGKGNGERAAKVEISCGDFTTGDFTNETEGAIYWKITEGRKPMQSFKDNLTDTERWKVVAFLRSLKK